MCLYIFMYSYNDSEWAEVGENLLLGRQTTDDEAIKWKIICRRSVIGQVH